MPDIPDMPDIPPLAAVSVVAGPPAGAAVGPGLAASDRAGPAPLWPHAVASAKMAAADMRSEKFRPRQEPAALIHEMKRCLGIVCILVWFLTVVFANEKPDSFSLA